jgi:phosphoesterase RecJ-like protein
LPEAANGQGFVYTSVSIEQRPGLDELAVERVIEALRTTSEAEVAAVLKHADDGHWKVSLRSKTSVDVGSLANQLGGGGHKFAAGYSSTVDLNQTVVELIDSLNAVSNN